MIDPTTLLSLSITETDFSWVRIFSATFSIISFFKTFKSELSELEKRAEQASRQVTQQLICYHLENEIGKTSYTQMLNEDGGIETDLTVVCMGKNHFRIVTSAANREHDKFHILKYLSNDI